MRVNTARWLVLVGSIMVGMPVGSFYSWSVFINPMRLARPNFSSTASVHADSIVIAALSIACAVAGKILGDDTCFGLRKLSASGSLVSAIGLGLCGIAVMYDLEWLIYIGGFLNGFGMGAAYVCFIKAFKTAWSHMPGFAAGWVMMVSSAGSFVFVWICQTLLEKFSQTTTAVNTPSYTFFILGGILFVMQFFGSFLLVPPGNDDEMHALATPLVDDDEKEHFGDETDLGADDDDEQNEGAPDAATRPMSTGAVLLSPQFWLVMFVFFANLFPVLGVLSILASYLQSRFPGTSSTEAANILALVNVVGTVMRLFVGFAAGAFGSFGLFMIALVLQTILFVLLFFVISGAALTLWEFSAICIAAKICYGAGFTLVNLLVDEVFGKHNGTQVYGLVIFALMAAALAAPNVIVVWYHGCSDVHPCNTSSGAVVTNSSAGDDITDFFAVSFSITGAGALSLLGLFCMRHKKQGAGSTGGGGE
eukprot:INCI10747.1.p1 GENE.INCI10747.1~~INCI10747.1.p1  ORF type:complete len:478 (+),score=81.25 INCI10747.1:255-1688(+)